MRMYKEYIYEESAALVDRVDHKQKPRQICSTDGTGGSCRKDRIAADSGWREAESKYLQFLLIRGR